MVADLGPMMFYLTPLALTMGVWAYIFARHQVEDQTDLETFMWIQAGVLISVIVWATFIGLGSTFDWPDRGPYDGNLTR